MTMLRRISTLIATPGMPIAYARWCLSAMRKRGPYAPGARNGRVSVRWINFSEYWTYRNGIDISERRLLRRCRREACGGSSVAIDIGANVGLFTVEMAALGFRCHAFEPVAETHQRLNENVIESGFHNQVTCNQTAVGDRTGEVTFQLDTNSPGTNHVSPPAGACCPEISLVRVPMTSVDAYMAEHQLESIDVMKVDVEGFEAAVFRGAHEALSRGAIRAILFEVCPPLLARAGESAGSVYGILRDLGYRVYRLAEDGWCGEELNADHLNQIKWANVMAVPR